MPELLPQPTRDELDLPTVMAALSDPIRLTILHRYLVDGGGEERACGWVGIDRPKSTLTHHFRALREAGLIEQRQYGLERRVRVRVDDVAERFPGLLDMVLAWQTPRELLVDPLPPVPSGDAGTAAEPVAAEPVAAR